MIRQFRYHTNQEYKDKIDIDSKDERNQYIRRKAWASAAYMYVIIAALGIILLKIIGQDQLLMGLSISVGILIVLFWIFYFYLQRKE